MRWRTRRSRRQGQRGCEGPAGDGEMREKHGELLLENRAGGWPKGGANVPWGGTRDCENADAEKFANENKGDVAREQDMATGWTTLVMVGDTLANWCWEGGWQLEEPAGWGECGKL
jgi:hypothetical protein